MKTVLKKLLAYIAYKFAKSHTKEIKNIQAMSDKFKSQVEKALLEAEKMETQHKICKDKFATEIEELNKKITQVDEIAFNENYHAISLVKSLSNTIKPTQE